VDHVPYEKPYLTIDEQLAQLEARGLVLGDRAEAAEWLRRVGYYRLSGYWYPFRKSKSRRGVRTILDTFVEGTTLAQVTEIYEFDRRLRLLVMDGIERVEVSLRFHVGHVLGRRGTFAHADPEALDGEFAAPGSMPAPALGTWMNSDHARWLRKRLDEERRSKADFVKHFRDKYGLPLPVWVVTEILDFGGLSLLYGGMLQRDRDEVAAALGLFDASRAGNGGALKDWLRNLNYVRNICAHHARLWNTNIVDRISPRALRPVPELAHIADAPPNATSRLYATLAVLSLLTARIHPADDWTDRVMALVSALPAGRNEAELGFPDGWRELMLWGQKPLV
jgi:abortive infection bacteriophage resistance protein